ncbi:hypothetical protein E2C01_001630 [Portunus trituberculatus]|uniref:Secreted protein n=1 Tax=Portunus trituberculatus TaxID=210409 RepID=A0A5B7CIK2_PORTR|nr:hypothetical protein [Portunus trituberculatus]
MRKRKIFRLPCCLTRTAVAVVVLVNDDGDDDDDHAASWSSGCVACACSGVKTGWLQYTRRGNSRLAVAFVLRGSQ